MKTMQLRSHVGSDGVLRVDIPVGVQDTDLDVVLVIQPLNGAAREPTPEDLGWPPGFFEETVGGWQGEPLVREPQGDYEIREELK